MSAVHDPTAFVLGGVAGHAGLFSTITDVCRVLPYAFLLWHLVSVGHPHAVDFDCNLFCILNCFTSRNYTEVWLIFFWSSIPCMS